MKHTKGPWKITQNSRRNIMIHSVLGRQVAKTILHPGDVPEESLSTFKGSPQDFANAHLIAAAPEMLEALSEVLRMWLPIQQAYVSETNAVNAVNKIDAILKKARGEL